MTTTANTSTDRTSEFHSIVQMLKTKIDANPQLRTQLQANGISTQHKNGGIALIRSRKEFNATAKKLGSNLSATFEKLEKLAFLCKQRNLFDDRPVEISELTAMIHQDIAGLKKSIASLQVIGRNLSQQANGRKDVDKQMNAQIKELSSRVSSVGSNFLNVIEIRKKNVASQNERRQGMFDNPAFTDDNSQRSYNSHGSGKSSSKNYNSRDKNIPHETSNLLSTPGGPDGIRNRKNMNQTGQAFAAFEKFDDSNNSVLMQDEYNNQKQLNLSNPQMTLNSHYQDQQMLMQENNYAQDREKNMETIETAIVEIGNVMGQLAGMVQEQQDMVTRIDANIEQAEMNIEGAHSEILKYFQSVTNNRWLMAKVFGTIVTFFIIFIIFFS